MPTFVQYICDFTRSHAAIELAAYFQSDPGVAVGPRPEASEQEDVPELPHADGRRRSVERRYAAIGSRPSARSIAPFGCAPMTAAAGSPSRKRIIVGIDITP